ncbi:MAG TPA: hypothetical protein VEF92_00410 [Burkholderiales bacterium]|nr:hypothetical protein [Burkholderiales bacterium]
MVKPNFQSNRYGSRCYRLDLAAAAVEGLTASLRDVVCDRAIATAIALLD